MKIFWKHLVVFNLDAGGGAAGGGASGAAGAGAGGAAAGSGAPSDLAAAAAAHAAANPPSGQAQGQGQGQQSQAYYPENLPDTFRGANDRETIDKLYGDIANRPKAPASAKDYKFEFASEFTDKFGDMKSDPVLPIWSEIAHEIGLSNEQAQSVVPKLFEKMAKAGLIPEPIDINAEMQKLEPNETDPVRRTAKAAARVNAIAGTLKGLETRGILTKADASRLSVMFADAANVAAFEKIIKLLPAEHGLQNGGQASDGLTPQDKAMRSLYPSMFK
ncbi:hypothetical protein [Hyphomicrobium sp. DY-1]|uniref:hypothetical protein n=1 Tax=Hyphomicrobium sp. DY-1 TaxID=3075650 RepID=UPI0039C21E10